MATIESYNRSFNVLSRLSINDGNTVKTIYEPGVATPYDVSTAFRYHGLLTDLRLKVDISSVSEVPLPNLTLLSSPTEKVIAARELEWNSPRKELRLYLATSNQPRCHIASISLLNRRPYYHVNLMPYLSDNGVFNIANDAVLQASIVDVGTGLLQGNDEVVFFGSVREEISAIPTQPRVIEFTNPFRIAVGTSTTPILTANPFRIYATLQNDSQSPLWLSFGSTAQVHQGIALFPGERFEINQANLYKGSISAIAESSGCFVVGLEGF